MKAIVIKEFGGPEVLQVENRNTPSILPTEVLIQVHAAGVNRPDVFQRKGNYPSPPGVASDIPGLEVAGVIQEVGSMVTSFVVGQRVMALVAGAGYAEYVAAPEQTCIEIPASISFQEAAGMPETLFTVWHNVFQLARLQPGEKLLVHGGTGGIGLTAIQLAKLMGSEVIVTVGSTEKKEFVQQLGVSQAINYRKQDFETVLKDFGVNVILDSIGGDYFSKNMNVLAVDGRLVQINAMQGRKVAVDLLQLMQKRILLTGSTLRNRTLTVKESISRDIQKTVMPFVENGGYKTYIAQVFPFDQAVAAHSLMESRDFIGKIILEF